MDPISVFLVFMFLCPPPVVVFSKPCISDLSKVQDVPTIEFYVTVELVYFFTGM